LIAWSAHERGKAAGISPCSACPAVTEYTWLDFTAYAQMAMSLALDLGLSDSQGVHRLASTPQERARIQAAWSSVVNLHIMPSA
jgi:hypothetical protein